MLSTRGSETGKTLSSLQGALYDRNGESSAMGMCTRQAPPGWRGCSRRTSRVVREGRGGTHRMLREQLEQRQGERRRPLGELESVLHW